MSVTNCFIRGSVVRFIYFFMKKKIIIKILSFYERYVQLPAKEVDKELLQDSARLEARELKKK